MAIPKEWSGRSLLPLSSSQQLPLAGHGSPRAAGNLSALLRDQVIARTTREPDSQASRRQREGLPWSTEQTAEFGGERSRVGTPESIRKVSGI
ncbi:hypothetical protein AAFF_G00226010 [Aldrovandia affinis]|uniref:Uncharacterized protein n=1 Tax=Aldrovandia affinis TaxID=143900 RepID=A0AAD7TBJ9_9TELE|nr:hypothetical protein AAFF_G00226010 [Aldrovandia affinis]